MTSLIPTKMISEGILKLERVEVICPACGQQVEAVAKDGQVKGYCAVANHHIDFLIEIQRVAIGKHPVQIGGLTTIARYAIKVNKDLALR